MNIKIFKTLLGQAGIHVLIILNFSSIISESIYREIWKLYINKYIS